MSKRLAVVAVIVLAAALAYGVAPVGAEVVPATTGFLTMTSDPGDYVGQGASYSYSPPSTTFAVQNGGNLVRLDTSVPGSPADFWNLAFQAPSGQPLQPGTTYQAQRWPFQPSGSAGLEVFGQGRGCNTLTGSFTILDAMYGPFGYLESFHATFEQHCEGAAAALRGEVEFVTPSPPPALALTVGANAAVTISRSGAVTLQGTIACTQPVTVALTGTAVESLHPKKATASAQFAATVNCAPGAAGTWQATLTSSTGAAFTTGSLQLSLQANATDPFYSAFTGTTITAQSSTTSTVNVQRG